MVRRYVRNLRRRINEAERKDLRNKELKSGFATASIRKVAVLLMKQLETLKEEEKTFMDTLLSNNQEIEKIRKLGTEFQELIRERKAVKFDAWLESAAKSGIIEMTGFAWGLKQDKEAVMASMEFEWSNGQVEGQVNRLKVIKRQMSSRGSFDLLKTRVLHQF